MKLPDREEQIKILKFLVVGGTNTAIMYGLYVLLLYVGLPWFVALTADYSLGIVYGYLLNRYWTFRSHGKPTHGFSKYCASYGGMFAVNSALLTLFVEGFGWRADIGQIPAIGLAMIAVYGLQRFWVFKPA